MRVLDHSTHDAILNRLKIENIFKDNIFKSLNRSEIQQYIDSLETNKTNIRSKTKKKDKPESNEG
jgi:hypothetical protein